MRRLLGQLPCYFSTRTTLTMILSLPLRTLGPQALDLAVTIPVFAINFDAVTTIRDALDQMTAASARS